MRSLHAAQAQWNLWHGCQKLSEGCRHCYVYRQDARYGVDAASPRKTKAFTLPIQTDRQGRYKLQSGTMVWTCFSSDFFLEAADEWRKEAWEMIRRRPDLHFFMITKRVDRFYVNLPADWGAGYTNVTICCTCENQDRADYRLPIYLQLPIRHKMIICEPLLGPLDISAFLSDQIEGVIAGGESGQEARICDYDWVLSLAAQCREKEISFTYKQTGAYLRKDGRLYCIPRAYQHRQARKAGINYVGRHIGYQW